MPKASTKAPQVPGGAAPTPSAQPEAETAAKAPKASTKAPGELPDAADIDPKTISRSVLTKQGWVCPG